jgi:hypothetical protein
MSDIKAKISQSGLLKGSTSSQQEVVASRVEVNTAGINLGDLSDVVITSPADGSYVVYQSSSNTFIDDQTITKTANGINLTGNTTIAYGRTLNFTSGNPVYSAMNLGNNNITGVNHISFADAGAGEGLRWENIQIVETNDGLTGNSAGDLQITYKQSDNSYARRLTVRDTGIDVVGSAVISGTATFAGGTTSADLNFGDSDKAVFGASGNLKIYFDGNHSYVYDTGPGDLRVRGNNLYLQNDTGGNYLSAINGGATTLFHNGNTKIATTANGLSITGRAEATEEFRSDIFRGSTYASASYLDFDDDETRGSSEATTLESIAAMNLKFDNNANDGQKFRIFGNTDGTNTAAFTIDDSLRVGINTETPNCKFHIKDITNVPVKIETTHGSGNARILFKPGANDGWNIGANDNGNFTIYDVVGGQNSVVVESGAGINTLFVDAGSQVGIGTNDPNRKLHVKGSGNTVAIKVEATDTSQASLDMQNSAGWFRFITNDGALRIYDQGNNAERWRISNSGNVGIGANNPSNQLTLRDTSGGETSGIKWDNGHDSVKAYFNTGDAESDFFLTYVGTNNPEIKLQHDGDIVLNGGASSGNIFLNSGNSTGKVGVGLSNPSEALHVNGNVKATQFKGELLGTINTATTATTQSASDNSTKVATTAYVTTAVAAGVSDLVGGAGDALDTLNELAAALGNDASFSTTVSTALTNRLRVDVNNQSLNATQKTNALTNLGVSSFGISLIDDADAAAARTTLGLGSAATTASSDYVAASSLSTFGGTLIDDADASAARTTLGLGTAATIDFDGEYASLNNKPTLYTDAAVDTHLNQSTAGNNEVLSWTGSDYDWVSGGIALTSLSVGSPATANGTGGISYNNSTGVFTYTPPELLQLGTTSTTALAGDTALLQLGTTSTTAMAGNTTFAFSDITSKPTTISGYGITDALAIGTSSTTAMAGDTTFAFADITSKPTTISGYGITDALAIGTSSTTAMAGDTTFAFADITSKPTTISGYGITDALTIGTSSTTAMAGDTTFAFADITSKPTTISGYGITDAFDGAFASLSSKPTTISGYGITDALALGTTATTALAGNTPVIKIGDTIVSTSAADIELDPNAGGKVVFKGNATRGSGQFVLNCENNSHGIIIKGPPHSAGASYTLVLPNDTGSNGQVLKTDGNGNLSWVSQTAAYTDSSVDTHLNVSSASSGQILSWNGSDYAWVADQTGGGGGSVRTVKVDLTGDGTVDNTLESSEELVLKAGTNVTLAEDGGVVTINSQSGGSSVTIKDEDDMASDSATAVPSQQSVKAYVDNNAIKRTAFFNDEVITLTNNYIQISPTMISEGTPGIKRLREVEFSFELDYLSISTAAVNDIIIYFEVKGTASYAASSTMTATHVYTGTGFHRVSFPGNITGYFGPGALLASSNTANSYSHKYIKKMWYDPSVSKTYVEYDTYYGALFASGTLTVYISPNGFLTSTSVWKIVQDYKMDLYQASSTTRNTIHNFRCHIGVYDGTLEYRIRAREVLGGGQDAGRIQEIHGTIIDSVWEE